MKKPEYGPHPGGARAPNEVPPPPDGGCSYFSARLSFPGGLVKMQVLVFLVLEWSVCTFNEPPKMLTVLVLALTHGVTVQQGLSGVLSFSVLYLLT